jgi:hypothetical protein
MNAGYAERMRGFRACAPAAVRAASRHRSVSASTDRMVAITGPREDGGL